MFCSKKVKHALDCTCHTVTSSTVFTYTELHSMYLVMKSIVGGKDVFSGFLGRLRQVNIAPTYVYICKLHRRAEIDICPFENDSFICGCIDDDVRYAGCINELYFDPSQRMYSNRVKLEHLLSRYCYNFDDLLIQYPKLVEYFPGGIPRL